MGLIPGLGRSPGKGKGYPLQSSGLENSMDYMSMRLQRVRHDWATFIFSSQEMSVPKLAPSSVWDFRVPPCTGLRLNGNWTHVIPFDPSTTGSSTKCSYLQTLAVSEQKKEWPPRVSSQEESDPALSEYGQQSTAGTPRKGGYGGGGKKTWKEKKIVCVSDTTNLSEALKHRNCLC